MSKKSDKVILLIGTYDTKSDELNFLSSVIKEQGGSVLTMDVSVLGESVTPIDYSKHDVASEAESSIESAIACSDENEAMQIMARGASSLSLRLYTEGKFDGVLILGGSMGTDLALDVCIALPLGVPKYIVSTISFSPLIPPDRLASDIQMILWSGGLYGLNSICRSSLSQAAGSVLGSSRSAIPPDFSKPLIGMTSLGKTALSYMVSLKPALEQRGYELVIFHSTGMGGRAFEDLSSKGTFACVFDFCTQELGNFVHGSDISSGSDRLTGAGSSGTPQLVCPGCYDLVDIMGWRSIPKKWESHLRHVHNRLITSIVLNDDERHQVALAHSERLSQSKGEVAVLLPMEGLGEWDRAGSDLHNKASLDKFLFSLESSLPSKIDIHKVAGHINDPIFSDTALSIFDSWCERGIIT